MAANTQSNPVYYSLATGQNTSLRTVVLHRRPDQDGFGVFIGEDVPSGLYVVTVERGSPADLANVQPGDRVLAVNGQTVTSMTTNPKDIVVKAATNASSLTLTIQPTNIFQILNITPLSNSSVDNKLNHHSYQQQPWEKTLDRNTDLEGYIRSLLSNENTQLYPSTSSINNDFIISTDPPAVPSVNSHSLSSDHSRPTEYKHEDQRHRHHHRHHHPRRQSNRKRLVTQETQTSVNDNEVEAMPQEQPPSSPKPQYPSQPTMGTSQRATRAQQAQNNNDTINQSQESRPTLIKKDSDFTAMPPSPASSKSSASPPPPVTYQKPLPATTAALFGAAPSASPNNHKLSSKKNTRVPSQHMVDVVQAAVRASRPGDQNKIPKEIPVQTQPAVVKQSTASLGSSPESSPGSERAAVTTAPTQSNQISPPPYTASSTYRSAEPANHQERPSQGSYNVRNAQENRPTRSATANVPPSVHGPAVREVHLQRATNFQGFGFHLQYNRAYYLVQRVESGSPAEEAGLRIGDVVLTINQQVTDKMTHAQFVQIVNASSEVDFLVQHVDEYLRVNPQTVRNQKPAPAAPQNDNEKSKSGFSKALERLKSR